MPTLLPTLADTLNRVQAQALSDTRKEVLKPLMGYINHKLSRNELVRLNFICTHNSRRSQFAQIWAQTAAAYHGVPVKCCSGGTEVTAFNERAVASIRRSGFSVLAAEGSNPVYSVFYSDEDAPIKAFSKKYDNPVNKSGAFAAVMTCAHAEENCPYIPGAEKRISLHYEDPKEFDNTPQETAKYDERSLQIAGEMFYVFSQIHNDK